MKWVKSVYYSESIICFRLVMKSFLNLIFMFLSLWVSAQSMRASGRPEWAIDTAQVENLNFTLNSTLFFQDNEFDTPMLRGYTLPGFKLRPSVNYRPNANVSVDLGIYMFKFWGSDSYPNLAYSDICEWTGKENVTKGLHLLPFFRVQMATNGGLNIVLGSIYGGMHHRLIAPLYAPELNLTADPEAGAQILYSNRWLDFDTWVNWESFIFKNDTHQEAFTFGMSSRIKYNRESSRLHFFTPVQILFQHRGGEIDTLLTNSVQTLFNGATGIGGRYNINHRAIKAIELEADALLYNQQVGHIWPIDHGWAYFLRGALDVANMHTRFGFYRSHKFVSLMGYPFFGSISTSNPDLTFNNYSTLFAGINYNHEFAPGYSFGADAAVYHHLPAIGYIAGFPRSYGASTSFYAAIYFRINPSFLIKSFKK